MTAPAATTATATAAPAPTVPVPATPLALYRRFVAAQPAGRRNELVRLPVVVVLGERARGGQSALVEAGIAWREAARKMQPSLTDADAPVRFYQGDELVAVELAIALVDDETAPARDALTGLFAELRGRDVSAVVVVEYDTLDPAAIDVLIARAERIRAKLDLLAGAIGAAVEARLCIVAADGGDGFGELAHLLAAQRLRVPIDVASSPPTVAAITSALAAVLPHGLTTLSGAAFARLVGFIAHAEGFATALAAFLAAFATPAAPAHTARLTDASLFIADGTLVGAPFPALDPTQLRPAPPLAWRHVLSRCLAIAACASLPVTGPVLVQRFAALPAVVAPPVTPPPVTPPPVTPPIASLPDDAGRADAPGLDATAGAVLDAGASPSADAGAAPSGDTGTPPACPPSPAKLDIALHVSTTRAVGIDISSYDPAPLPWAALKEAGVTFVYIKASEGLSTDSLFAAHWRDAKACGLLRGAYHLVRFNDDPARQAAAFVARLGADRGELPPAIDVEDSAVLQGEARPGATCERLHAALGVLAKQITSATATSPILYTSIDAWHQLGPCSDELSELPLWLKHYAPEYEIRMFGGWTTWLFWQRTGSATITGERPGRPHEIDVNEYHGTLDELRGAFTWQGPL